MSRKDSEAELLRLIEEDRAESAPAPVAQNACLDVANPMRGGTSRVAENACLDGANPQLPEAIR